MLSLSIPIPGKSANRNRYALIYTLIYTPSILIYTATNRHRYALIYTLNLYSPGGANG